jgi:HEAT repeat protein
LRVAKTQALVRREAIAALLAAKWVRSLTVTIENLREAESSEDDLDACVTAAGLLRCVLEKSPLCPSDLVAARSEGGMLGTGSVNLQLRSQTFG